MHPQTTPNKMLLGGIFGLSVGLYILWLTVDGLSRNEAMPLSRHAPWFHQQDYPADFVASVLLYTALSLVVIVISVGAIGRYFYLFDPHSLKRLPLSIFAGFVIASFIFFFANYPLFEIVGFPLLMLFGLPAAILLSYIWPPELTGGFLPPAGSDQLILALAYISGFLAWWLLASVLLYRRLRRMEELE